MTDKEDDTDFSLNNFRKWVSKQKFESKSRFLGCVIESKVSLKRLVTKMDVDQATLRNG